VVEQFHFGAILAGGRSERFGSPKAFAQIGGRTMLAMILAQYRRASLKPIIVANDPGSFWMTGETVVSDIIPGCGPLGGLHAALTAASDRGARGVCVTPCDAPLVDARLFTGLIVASIGYDAVLPIDDASARVQPLFGWYSCGLLPAVEDSIAEADLSVYRFVDRVRNTRYIHSDEMALAGLADRVFFNVNTPADMETARNFSGGFPGI
jgi:molybdopterin-guanine dinucleotide biosynthesis protein A